MNIAAGGNLFALAIGVLALVGCGGNKSDVVAQPDAGAITADAGTIAADADPAQVPPTVSEALDGWIANAPWKKWKCEAEPRGPRLNSPHDLVRVCENEILVNAPADGDLPVGAAAVKEMYDQGKVYALTIAVRGKPGPGGDKWFWWRKVIDGSETPAITNQGFGDGFCSGCHRLATSMGGRDNIFTFLR